MHLRNDGESNRCRPTPAEIETGGTVQAGLDRGRVTAEFRQQTIAAITRTQQTDVANPRFGERLEVYPIRVQVMAHGDCGIVSIEVDIARQLAGRYTKHVLRGPEIAALDVGRTVVLHGHTPAEFGTELDQRLGVEAAAKYQDARRRAQDREQHLHRSAVPFEGAGSGQALRERILRRPLYGIAP